jgi:hypothetical protein
MKSETIKRTLLILVAIMAAAAVVGFARSGAEQKSAAAHETEPVVSEQWEYLVVASVNSNLTPSDNPRMRKETMGAFGRESFVLEQNMDKLGAKGWELVSVSGHPSDPIYYFKRRK